jgi:hypothetical protein
MCTFYSWVARQLNQDPPLLALFMAKDGEIAYYGRLQVDGPPPGPIVFRCQPLKTYSR